MMTTQLIIHIILGLLLLLIPVGALYYLERTELKSFGIAVGRMVVQLAVLCLLVWALIWVDNTWFILLWFLGMAVYAAFLIVKRCKLDVKQLFLPICGGLFVGVGLVGLWVLGVALPVRVVDIQWIIPVMALLMGHATAMMIKGLSTYISALQADEEQYEFLHGNGLTHFKALLPFLRRSLLAVISPTVSNLSVLGLTAMPLLLVGLLLGGFAPLYAFVLMLIMVAGCVSASVLSLALSILFYELSKHYNR